MTAHRAVGAALAVGGGLAIGSLTIVLYSRGSVAYAAFQALLRIGAPGLLLLAFGGVGALGFGFLLVASPDRATERATERTQRMLARLRRTIAEEN